MGGFSEAKSADWLLGVTDVAPLTTAHRNLLGNWAAWVLEAGNKLIVRLLPHQPRDGLEAETSHWDS